MANEPTRVLLRGGRICQAGGKPGEPTDVLLSGHYIEAIAPAGECDASGAQVLDASGAYVFPGFVDIQVHFRTPGATDSEDLASGSAAAAAGGVTACVMMANTTPPVDNVDAWRELRRAADALGCDLFPAACVTLGRAGERLVDMVALYEAGARVFTDDGDAVADEGALREALAATVDLPGAVVAQHAEDPAQVAGGAINAGAMADRLGVKGRPAAGEYEMVRRDVALAIETGGRYHLLHTSTQQSVEAVLVGKINGARVSAEVTPQHLVLTEDDVERLGTTAKMNPPLRTAEHRAALAEAICTGAIDAVASDHAPHADALKAQPLADAPPGMTGVETSASVMWTHFVAGAATGHPADASPRASGDQPAGAMSIGRFARVMSSAPALIAGLAGHGGYIAAGRPANLTVFDPTQSWTVDAAQLHSKSHNNPWHGDTLTGRVRHTILWGEPTLIDAQVV